jgi:hypothetical protein
VLASTFFSLVILACIELDNTGSLCAAVIGACLLGVTLLSCRVAGLKALTGQPALLQLSNSLELPSTLVTALHFLKAQSNGSNDSGSGQAPTCHHACYSCCSAIRWMGKVTAAISDWDV